MSEFPELRSALVAAAERQVSAAEPEAIAPPRRRRRWPLRLRALLVTAAWTASAAVAVLIAVGVISFGGSVKLALPVRQATGREGAAKLGTARLLPVRASDPEGGPRWGLRTVRTTHGEVCLEVGRVVGTELGVLGQDGAFGDDGRLHPFAENFLDDTACALPDPTGHAYLSVDQFGYPASAGASNLVAGANGCRIGRMQAGDRRAACTDSELRDVYYGLLGPDAVSLTYRTASGGLRTVRTSGPDGAYLIVLPYHPDAGGAPIGDPRAGEELEDRGLDGSPFVSARYTDGRVCRPARRGGCGAIGELPEPAPHVTAAQVRAPVHVQLVRAHRFCVSRTGGPTVACDGRVPRGYELPKNAKPGAVLINVRVTARRAANGFSSVYALDDLFVDGSGPPCYDDGGTTPYPHRVRTGQALMLQDLVSRHCLGPVRGKVLYVAVASNGDIAPLSPGAHPVVVGRFTVDPARRRR